MNNVLDFRIEEFKEYLVDKGFKGFKADQISDWIYDKKVFNLENMSNLSKIEREKLKEVICISMPNIIEVQESRDGTVKFLLELEDKNLIECVFMMYNYGNTICISTQVGCRMGCKFCASTLNGFIRNLSIGELMSQVLLVENYTNDKINRIVLMGTGEPLYNYENVIGFIHEMKNRKGMSPRHITLSTCGIVPKIYDLSNENLSINLAISLHAVTDSKRQSIMPIANKYSLDELIIACIKYFEKTKRRVSFEYLLIEGVNDSEEDAYQLSKLCKEVGAHVNLIPMNEISENNFKESNRNKIRAFEQVLSDNGVNGTVRQKKGVDIDAACGQLRLGYSK